MTEDMIAYNLKDAIRVTSTSRSIILRNVKEGRLHAKRNGKKFLFLREELEAWMAGFKDAVVHDYPSEVERKRKRRETEEARHRAWKDKVTNYADTLGVTFDQAINLIEQHRRLMGE